MRPTSTTGKCGRSTGISRTGSNIVGYRSSNPKIAVLHATGLIWLVSGPTETAKTGGCRTKVFDCCARERGEKEETDKFEITPVPHGYWIRKESSTYAGSNQSVIERGVS